MNMIVQVPMLHCLCSTTCYTTNFILVLELGGYILLKSVVPILFLYGYGLS